MCLMGFLNLCTVESEAGCVSLSKNFGNNPWVAVLLN